MTAFAELDAHNLGFGRKNREQTGIEGSPNENQTSAEMSFSTAC
jgi:hypothetical protein